jgi:C_GCAxxG_C_C family probable redox protein
MEEDNGRSFNCAESVLIQINRESPLPGFGNECMRIASVLGGGISGFGEVCGAISGAVAGLGLLLGTNGDEEEELFKTKRTEAREIVKQYMQDFVDNWGSAQCRYLIEMDEGKRAPAGSLRSHGPPKRLCDEYVNWSAKKVGEIRKFLD